MFKKDQLLIERFNVKKSIKDVEYHPELKQYDNWEKLQLCIGYLFTQCMKCNGDMRYAWKNDKQKDVAVCYVFLGEGATEIQKIVEEYHKAGHEAAKDKQALAEEFMENDKLFYLEANTTNVIPKEAPKEAPAGLTFMQKVKKWMGI